MPDPNAALKTRPRTGTKPNTKRFVDAMRGVGADNPVKIATLLGYDETTIRRFIGGHLSVSTEMLLSLRDQVGLDEALIICNIKPEVAA